MKLYLNHLEIQKISLLIEKEIIGSTIERLIIPERPWNPKKYSNNEWVIRLKSKKATHKESALLFSTQNTHPYISFYSHKGPKAFEKAHSSVFLQALQKILKDTKIIQYHALPNERITLLECFSNSTQKTYVLITELIPAHPNCFLTEKTKEGLLILFQERGNQKYYHPPQSKPHSQTFTLREELISSLSTYTKKIETHLQTVEANKRFNNILKAYTQKKNYLDKNLSKINKSLLLTKKDPPWGYYGQLLKANLYQLKKENKKERSVFDFELNKDVLIPCTPQKSPEEEMEKFFQKEKRNKRKINELQSQLKECEAEIKELNLYAPPNDTNELSNEGLLKLEHFYFPHLSNKTHLKVSTPSIGKSFVTTEGHTITVGRKKEENLKITFQIAKGNDLWMHARGKPSAHLVILLKNKKTASLETLLDAAQLLIHFSKGSAWGKTEIDYTFRKFVKRIKGTDQVSYTQNKTLLVEPNKTQLDKVLKTAVL